MKVCTLRSVASLLALAGLAALAPREAAADIFVSEGADGSLSFTDKPSAGSKLYAKTKSSSKTAAA